MPWHQLGAHGLRVCLPCLYKEANGSPGSREGSSHRPRKRKKCNKQARAETLRGPSRANMSLGFDNLKSGCAGAGWGGGEEGRGVGWLCERSFGKTLLPVLGRPWGGESSPYKISNGKT